MKRTLSFHVYRCMNRWLLIPLAALACSDAHAQSGAPSISQRVAVCDPAFTGRCIKPNSDGSIPTTGGGSGGGPITAASGSYVAGSIVDLGTGASPAANTVNSNLGRIVTTLGSPAQAGASQPPFAATSTDASGSVTTGNTYQTAIASNGSRHDCLIQNPSTATEALLVKFGTMAQPITLAAGQSLTCNNGGVVATDAVTLTAVTTGHAFVGLSR